MKRIYIYIMCMCCAVGVKGQSFRSAFEQIMQNNTSVKAWRQHTEAERMGNAAERALPDPEAEVAYLFGSPKEISNRTNVSVTQELSWDVLLGHRRKGIYAANEVVKKAEGTQLQALRMRVDAELVRLVYYNKLCRELTRRLLLANNMERLYSKKYDEGSLNLMELNKVRLNSAVLQSEWQRAESERTAVLNDLQQFNGGKAVTMTDTVYPAEHEALPPLSVFEAALPANASVLLAQAQVAESEAALKVARAKALPQFTVGFQGEYVKQNNYSGVSLGLTLPLWGNGKRKVKQTKAELLARQLDVTDVMVEQQALVGKQYATAQQLLGTAASLKERMGATSNEQLLRRALDEGQINLLSYLYETTFYYNAMSALLEAERDAQLAVSALRALSY